MGLGQHPLGQGGEEDPSRRLLGAEALELEPVDPDELAGLVGPEEEGEPLLEGGLAVPLQERPLQVLAHLLEAAQGHLPRAPPGPRPAGFPEPGGAPGHPLPTGPPSIGHQLEKVEGDAEEERPPLGGDHGGKEEVEEVARNRLRRDSCTTRLTGAPTRQKGSPTTKPTPQPNRAGQVTRGVRPVSGSTRAAV